MATAGKLRLLVLHGYAANEFSAKRRMAALQKACRDVAEFVFVNAPRQVKALPSATNPDPSVPSPDIPLEKQARAWWSANDEGVYVGWADTAVYLHDVFQTRGPFDGVLGFSQGACLATVLCAALERPDACPASAAPFQAHPFRFAIAVSGFRPRDPAFNALFAEEIATPTLVVVGEEDVLVSRDMTQAAVDAMANSRIVCHDGGHFIPTNAPWRNFFRDFMRAFQDAQPDDWRALPAPEGSVPEEDVDSKL
ncbi:dihydrofolate reductase [Malassezia sp. CBS 17886]|nr:dihydrofolate reductase [Malassezia sp. CBS 17886]